jgi:large subunit ribosomal protein L11
MAKKVLGQIKLQVPAGQAKPAPPIGPALGQRGLNIMEFCKGFNAKTQEMEQGMPCPVVITYFVDKSFTFEIKTPPVSYFIKKTTGIASGAKKTGREVVGKITMDQCRDIGAKKMKDLNARDVEAAASMVAGSARSMGLEVVD